MRTRYYTRDEVVAHPIPKTSRFINLTGKKYQSGLVLAYAGNDFDDRRGRWWLEYACCGNIAVLRPGDVKRIKKCSHCINKTHGMSGTPEHRAWKSIRRRCNNKNTADYIHYGGKGIRVCTRWDSFALFLSDMGNRPSDQHSIDRIDCKGNYTSENCRWATPEQQSNNTSQNILITVGTETKTLSEWCGGSKTTRYRRAISRIHCHGWCGVCAVCTPLWGAACTHKGGEK